jgi:hypothetical protein
MPSLMHVGMWGSAVVGGFCALFLPLAAVGVGSYAINGEPVSAHEFLRVAGLLLAAIAGLLLAIAFAFWRERPWGRHAVLAFWLYSAAAAAALAQNPLSALGSVFECLAMAAVAAWYFYGKPNVVAYYRALRPAGGAPGAQGTRFRDPAA